MERKKQITIIGGGISGLSFAWHLQKKRPEIACTILEERKSAGGYMTSDEGIYPRGPRVFKTSTSGPLLSLVEELDFSKELFFPKKPHTRYVLGKGSLRKVPGIYLLRFFGSIVKELFTPSSSKEETVKECISRRFGSRFLEELMDPLVRGVFGGELGELSMQEAFPKFKEWEKRYGSVVLGMIRERAKSALPPLFTFKEGVESLSNKLESSFSGDFHKQIKIIKVEKKEEGFLLKGVGEEFYADEVVIATSAKEAANLLEGEAAKLLSVIPYTSITTAHTFLEEKALRRKGFGYLAPSKEEKDILGALFDQNLLHTSIPKVTFMLRGCLGKEEAETLVKRGLKEHLKIKSEPKKIYIQSYDAAIPQYTAGHKERVEALRESLPKGIHLLGNYLEGISVSDSVALAKKLAEDF